MKFVLFLFFLFLSLEAWAVADEELKEKVSSPRWLSIPGSRIVLNPTGISHTGALVSHLSGGALAGMVLNAGYFYGEHPERVADIWSWKPSDPEAAGNSLLSGRRTDLVSLNWKDTGSRGRKEGNRIILTQKDEKYGYIECEAIKTDVSKEPLIILDIKNGDGAKWALKVGLEGEHDITINPGCSEDGLFVFDLTGYIKSNPEDKKMYVRVFTVGPRGCSVTVNALYLQGIGDSARGFEEITEFWQPGRITHSAASGSRDISVNGVTFFADEDTVARRTIVTGGSSDLLLQGVWNKGTIGYKEGALILTHPSYSIVIAASGEPELFCYKDITAYLEGKTCKTEEAGFWTLRFRNVKKGDMINTAAVFVPGGLPEELHITKAKEMTLTRNISKALEKRSREWDTLLAKVPVPENFAIGLPAEEAEDINGFSAEEKYERMYYKAWVFLMQDLVPPQPENGYMHVQFATGKPSLWSEGHPRARVSAQWESIIAMQFAGLIMPGEAWDALEGIISLADEDGSIGGEGLPSRHCQTAWILYCLTGDKEKLAALYPGCKKILEWKARDPRWIYRGLTPEGEKDSEFVTQALTDMEYIQKICSVVKPEDLGYWQKQREALYNDYTKWFWNERGGDAFRVNRGAPAGPHNTWTLVGLALAKDILQEPEKESLFRLYQEKLNPEIPLFLENFSKHPSRQLLMRGLLWSDRYEDARLIEESTLRDITRAGEFAESYNNGGPITPEGVVPSIFGVANIIDSCMWLNNVWLSEGFPMFIPQRTGGVSNLQVRGRLVNLQADESKVYISGETEGMALTGFTENENGTWERSFAPFEKIDPWE